VYVFSILSIIYLYVYIYIFFFKEKIIDFNSNIIRQIIYAFLRRFKIFVNFANGLNLYNPSR